MKHAFSPSALIVISSLMMAVGISLDLLVWFGLIAQEEPPLVVHLSTFALIFAGYGNVITALVNREVKK